MAENRGEISDNIFSAQINGLARKALSEQQPCWTNFLDPAQRDQAQAILSWTVGVRSSFFGGYPKAERQRLVVYPDYYLTETINPELAYLEIATNSQEPLNHRDYLGAILGLGINRETVGDLLVATASCQVIVLPELADFIKANLNRIGNCSAKITEIEAEQLNPPTLKQKVIKSTVASLRLDAIAALGFGESRTKMAREIKTKQVKVNWQLITDPDSQVDLNDTISIRGRGRVILQELTGRSKKGRLGVVLVRLL